jgi:hypothetical protein
VIIRSDGAATVPGSTTGLPSLLHRSRLVAGVDARGGEDGCGAQGWGVEQDQDGCDPGDDGGSVAGPVVHELEVAFPELASSFGHFVEQTARPGPGGAGE